MVVKKNLIKHSNGLPIPAQDIKILIKYFRSTYHKLPYNVKDVANKMASMMDDKWEGWEYQ